MLHSDILPEHDCGGGLTQRQPSSSAVCVLGQVEKSGKIGRASGNIHMPYPATRLLRSGLCLGVHHQVRRGVMTSLKALIDNGSSVALRHNS